MINILGNIDASRREQEEEDAKRAMELQAQQARQREAAEKARSIEEMRAQDCRHFALYSATQFLAAMNAGPDETLNCAIPDDELYALLAMKTADEVMEKDGCTTVTKQSDLELIQRVYAAQRECKEKFAKLKEERRQKEAEAEHEQEVSTCPGKLRYAKQMLKDEDRKIVELGRYAEKDCTDPAHHAAESLVAAGLTTENAFRFYAACDAATASAGIESASHGAELGQSHIYGCLPR